MHCSKVARMLGFVPQLRQLVVTIIWVSDLILDFLRLPVTIAIHSFRSDTPAVARTVTLTMNHPSGSGAIVATVAVYVNGVQVGSTQPGAATVTFNAGTLGVGAHGVIVRAVTGTFALSLIEVK